MRTRDGSTLRRSLFLASVLFSIVTIAAGFAYYRSERDGLLRNKEQTLRSIARLKADLITAWYADEQLDAELISQNTHLEELVAQWMASQRRDASDELVEQLSLLRAQHDYADIVLASSSGEEMLRVNAARRAPNAPQVATIRRSAADRRTVLSGLYRNPATGKVQFDIAVPLLERNGRVHVVLLFCIDPVTALFEPMQRWPIPTETAESVLLREENGGALFVSGLRFHEDAALNLRLPPSRSQSPAVQAVLGKSGVVEAIDYSGTPVLAYITAVAGTPWYMVAKVAKHEIYAELRFKAGVALGAVILIILLTSAVMAWLYNRRERRMLRALNETEERLRLTQFAVDNTQMAVYRVMDDGRIAYANAFACESLGYTRQELTGMKVWEIDPNRPKEKWSEYRRETRKAGSFTSESVHRRKDGSEMPVEITVSFLEYAGQKYSFTFVKDISERKRAEKELRRRIEEKELLLREIHHRVKNNLAVITSLLRLQANEMQHAPEAVAAIEKSRDRIQSMTLVHKMLYQSADFTRIDMKPYVEGLVNDLMQIHSATGQASLELRIANISLDATRAIPCGIIINELATNAFKHAIPHDRRGTIGIELAAVDENSARLAVHDNGPGLPDPAERKRAQSLGMQLIEVLTSQLHGELEISSNAGGGARFTITFPIS